MDSTATFQIITSLEKIRESQIKADLTVQRHGELLLELVSLQRNVIDLAKEMKSINRAKAFSPDAMSNASSPPPLSPQVLNSLIRWAVAGAAVAFVAKGGDPGPILKALAPLLGG